MVEVVVQLLVLQMVLQVVLQVGRLLQVVEEQGIHLPLVQLKVLMVEIVQVLHLPPLLVVVVEQLLQEQDELLNEVSQTAAKENLEVGCRIIKSTVFESALKRVHQDPMVIEAHESRRMARQQQQQFVDHAQAKTFKDLPEMLSP